jgi:hypothetical protein
MLPGLWPCSKLAAAYAGAAGVCNYLPNYSGLWCWVRKERAQTKSEMAAALRRGWAGPG